MQLRPARRRTIKVGVEPPAPPKPNEPPGKPKVTATFDGYDVLGAGGFLWIIACAFIDQIRSYAWIGLALVVLWIVVTLFDRWGWLPRRKES